MTKQNEACLIVLEKLSEAKKLGLPANIREVVAGSFEPREQWWLLPLEQENTRFGKTIGQVESSDHKPIDKQASRKK